VWGVSTRFRLQIGMIPPCEQGFGTSQGCSRRKGFCSDLVTAGLSRRRSRVRVPSLPSLEVPANRQVALSGQARGDVSWPNPVAQTSETKCLQKDPFVRQVCIRPHESKSDQQLDTHGLRPAQREDVEDLAAERLVFDIPDAGPWTPNSPPLRLDPRARVQEIEPMEQGRLLREGWDGRPTLGNRRRNRVNASLRRPTTAPDRARPGSRSACRWSGCLHRLTRRRERMPTQRRRALRLA
jgi:hypothetical protein